MNSLTHASTERFAEDILDDIAPSLMHKHHVPGIAAAGIRDGEIAWQRQYGVKASPHPDPVTENTVFEACSLSKPFFAYAVLKLVEQSAMGLDTPLVEYLGRPYIENEPLHEKITARMVLLHTSGLPNWRTGGRDGGQPLVVHFEPGTGYQYSGEGFWFLQRAVERITGTSLEAWMEGQLLKPLGMTSSSYVWQQRFGEFAAAGHGEHGQARENRKLFEEANAAFSLYTTAADYAKFLLEILRPDRSAPHSVNAKSLGDMLHNHWQVPPTLPEAKPISRGLGWEIQHTDAGVIYGHSGNNINGFRCVCRFVPESQAGIVILTNGDNGAHVWQEILAVLEPTALS